MLDPELREMYSKILRAIRHKLSSSKLPIKFCIYPSLIATCPVRQLYHLVYLEPYNEKKPYGKLASGKALHEFIEKAIEEDFDDNVICEYPLAKKIGDLMIISGDVDVYCPDKFLIEIKTTKSLDKIDLESFKLQLACYSISLVVDRYYIAVFRKDDIYKFKVFKYDYLELEKAREFLIRQIKEIEKQLKEYFVNERYDTSGLWKNTKYCYSCLFKNLCFPSLET